jgi:hypothetical protein
MVTKAYNLLQAKSNIKAVMLLWKKELLFTTGQKRSKGIAGFRYKRIYGYLLNCLVDFHDFW